MKLSPPHVGVAVGVVLPNSTATLLSCCAGNLTGGGLAVALTELLAEVSSEVEVEVEGEEMEMEEEEEGEVDMEDVRRLEDWKQQEVNYLNPTLYCA